MSRASTAPPAAPAKPSAAAEERPYPVGMWDDERAHPWRALGLYLIVMALGMLGAHGQAAGWW